MCLLELYTLQTVPYIQKLGVLNVQLGVFGWFVFLRVYCRGFMGNLIVNIYFIVCSANPNFNKI